MGQIDVSEILLDPDFVEPLTLVHRKSYTNELGQNVITETPLETNGSVQPASGRTLQRLPEALRVANVSSFWIQSEIVADGRYGEYPDVIDFKGVRYTVQVIFDWTNWGAGWCEGTCVQEKPTL